MDIDNFALNILESLQNTKIFLKTKTFCHETLLSWYAAVTSVTLI